MRRFTERRKSAGPPRAPFCYALDGIFKARPLLGARVGDHLAEKEKGVGEGRTGDFKNSEVGKYAKIYQLESGKGAGI